MKKLYIMLLTLSFYGAIAQQNEATVSLGKKQDVSNIIPLGIDGGFILHVSEQYAGREKNSELYYYTPNLENKWKVKIDNPTNNLLAEFLIGSAFSNYVYYIQEKKTTTLGKGEYIITRIDKEGDKTLFSFKITSDYSKATKIAAYTDEVGLNFMVQTTPKVKKGEQQKTVIQIYQVKHDKKSFEQLNTNIKELISDEDQDIFIEYLGHDDANVYLSQKVVSVAENAVKYTVYTVSKTDYSVTNEDEFIVEAKNELVASTNLRNTDGARVYNNDYTYSVSTVGRTTTITYYANAGSFGCAKLDLASGHFYVYGLTSAKKFGTTSSKDKKKKTKSYSLVNDVAGAYVVKFDFNDGKEISRDEFVFNKDIPSKMNVSNFYTRALWLDILTPSSYRLSVAKEYNPKDAQVFTTFVTSNTKPEYKPITFPARKDESLWHMRFLSNLALTNSIAPSEAVNFAGDVKEIRNKEYSKFGILLPNKIILAKNYSYTKIPKIEFVSYDLNK